MAHCVEGRIAGGEGIARLGEVIGEEMVKANGRSAELLLRIKLRVCHCSGSGRVKDRRQRAVTDGGRSRPGTDTESIPESPSSSPIRSARLCVERLPTCDQEWCSVIGRVLPTGVYHTPSHFAANDVLAFPRRRRPFPPVFALMASSAVKARINAFEAMQAGGPVMASRSPPDLLETPISPTATSISPILPSPTPRKSMPPSPSPSPPNLGRKTSLIDLKDWVVDDGPLPYVPRQRPPIARKAPPPLTPKPTPRHVSDSVVNKHSPPLISLDSPPKTRPAPPLPPRKSSYTSLKSISPTNTSNSSSRSPRPPVPSRKRWD